MYITVQKVYGKAKVYGYSKDVVTNQITMGTTIRYSWHYSEDRFERENYSYKIIVKESYRANGKVKQHQVVMGTFRWFDFIDHYVYGDELFDEKLHSAFPDMTEEQEENIYDEIDKKVDKIESIESALWIKSQEFKVHNRHLEMIHTYECKKKQCDENLGEGYFEQIYDIHMEIMNQELYGKIRKLRAAKEKADKEKREYEQKSYEGSQKQWKKFYENCGSSSYSIGSGGNYTDKERDYLKKFYRALAAKFHPDVTNDNEVMQFLNKLKEQWGI